MKRWPRDSVRVLAFFIRNPNHEFDVAGYSVPTTPKLVAHWLRTFVADVGADEAGRRLAEFGIELQLV